MIFMDDKRYFYMSDIDNTITVEYATRKEMLELIDNYVENCKTRDEMIANNNSNAYLYDMSQETFTILYKDGTTEYIDEDFDGHHVKRQHIESIVNENSSTVMVYGHFGLNECGVAEPTFNDEIDNSLKEVDTDDYTESNNTTETNNDTTKTESDTTETTTDSTNDTTETTTDNTTKTESETPENVDYETINLFIIRDMVERNNDVSINNVLESLGNKQLIQKYVDGINNGLQNDSYKQTRECFCKLVQILPDGYEICFTTKFNVDMTKVDEPIYNHRYKIIRDKTGIMFNIHKYSEVEHKFKPMLSSMKITDIPQYIYHRTFDSVCRVFKKEFTDRKDLFEYAYKNDLYGDFDNIWIEERELKDERFDYYETVDYEEIDLYKVRTVLEFDICDMKSDSTNNDTTESGTTETSTNTTESDTNNTKETTKNDINAKYGVIYNTITKLEKLFDIAEKYKNSYTWNKDNGNAQQREWKEKQDSIDVFEWYDNGDKYTAEYVVKISRTNVYAYGLYTKNEHPTTLTAIKNSYKRLLQAVQRE